jgi:hypothetical protein
MASTTILMSALFFPEYERCGMSMSSMPASWNGRL